MNDQLIMTFAILLAAVALFLSERLRADLVALLVVVALGLTGVLTPPEAFSGFSSSAVVTIVAVFVLAEGLRITGATEQAGLWLLKIGGAKERRLVATVMVGGAFMSLFMNNIAAAAVLLPAAVGVASRARVSASRLLLPLAYATILGGMATLFTTTNIIASGLLRAAGLQGYGVLDFLPVGIPVVVAGVTYMALWGRRRLPEHTATDQFPDAQPGTPDLVGVYRLNERLFSIRVPAGSELIGKRLTDSGLRGSYGLNVVAVEQGGRVTPAPEIDTFFRASDVILAAGRLDEFRQRDVPPYLEILPPREWRQADLESESTGLAEAIVAPRSTLLGQTLRALHFHEKFGMNVLGIWRGGRPIRTGLGDTPLQAGDALLLYGPRASLPLLRAERDLVMLHGGPDSPAVQSPAVQANTGRRALALAVMVITLVIAAFRPLLIGEVMLAGALAMVLLGVLTADGAYQAIDWRSVFLVAGMLPLGLAMATSGAAAFLAERLVALLGPLGPMALLSGLFILTMALAQTMHGAAVATVMVPIAIQAAQQTGINPRSLVMGVTLATSMAFLTPLGHPVNVLVMTPGGYRPHDYARVGWPLTVLLTVLILWLLPHFWPL